MDLNLLLRGFFHILVVLIFPPFFLGIISRTKALWAGRKSVPLLQVYFDLYKLLRKGEVIGTTTSWVFRIAPIFILASTIMAGLIIPVGWETAPLNFSGDFIFFIYMLALGKVFSVVSALDTGSSFEAMGASREISFSGLAEPAFFILLTALSLFTRTTNFSALFSFTYAFERVSVLFVVISSIVLLLMIIIEGCRVPVDDPRTHLELTMIHEVMILDNSGPNLAFIMYASAIKMVLFGVILANIMIPGETSDFITFVLIIGILLLIAVIIGTIESVMARFRFIHIPEFIFFLSSLGLIVFSIVILKVYGGLQ